MMKKFFNDLRIIWAIAAKDIVDAIRNKMVLGIMVGVAFMMLSSQALPLIMKGRTQPRAFYFDEGKSNTIRQIVRNQEVELIPQESKAELIESIGSSPVPVLGLVIPGNFDELVATDSPIHLFAYKIHWATPSELAPVITHFENALGAQSGKTVRIQIIDDPVFPDPKAVGFSLMIITGFVMGVMILGLILVPLLIIDEKETHTLEVLMVSPAKTFHLLAGKSLTGMVYSLAAAVVMFIFTWRWFVQWEIAIVAVVLGAGCAVVIGLLLGSMVENPSTINLWSGLMIIVLLLPAFLWTSFFTKLDPTLKMIIQVLPSIAMSNLIGISLSDQILIKPIVLNILLMILFTAIVLALLGWSFRRTRR